MIVLKENPHADVRWELDDGKHAVTVADEIVGHTAVESLGRITYEEAVAERAPTRPLREKERPHCDMEAARSESFARRAANARRRADEAGAVVCNSDTHSSSGHH